MKFLELAVQLLGNQDNAVKSGNSNPDSGKDILKFIDDDLSGAQPIVKSQ